MAATGKRGSRLTLTIRIIAAAGLRRVNEMVDAASTLVQVLSVTLSFGALVMLARAQRTRTSHPEKQPVPIPVERDRRER